MVFFSLMEVVDVVMMTLAIGFIFKDFVGGFVQQVNRGTVYQPYDPLAQYSKKKRSQGFWNTVLSNKFYLAMLIAAPAIIVHELFHKFFALGFGHVATFNAAYGWLAFGVILRLIGVGLVFFVPAYVSILPGISAITSGQSALIAFAGPLANLLIYLGCVAYMRYGKPKRKYLAALVLTRRINGFLFIFNMIPLPFFDGSKVFSGLFDVLSTLF